MASKFGLTVTRPIFFRAHVRKPSFSVCSLLPSAPGVGTKKLCFRRRLLVISPKATADQPGQVQEDVVVDSNVLPYCSMDKKQKKTLGEMEQEFLQALQAFYYEGKSVMSNEEFDNLKEELMWEGSSVVMLSPDEQRFLEASMAYVSGKPIMSDEEFDKLKKKLKIDGSEIVVEGPRCSLRSRKLPEPFSFIFTWFAALPLILYLSSTITNFVVKDFLILVGPCPNCGAKNTSFFGTILSVSSGGSINRVKCSNCEMEMIYDSLTRLITLPEGSEA